jgi:hypothetical protein
MIALVELLLFGHICPRSCQLRAVVCAAALDT